MTMNDSSDPWRNLARVLLGSLVVGQLLFLLASNFSPWWQRAWPSKEIRATATLTNAWSQLTGQPQDWSLFAPEVGRDYFFVAVQLQWGDQYPPVLLLSDNEPSDLRHYFRVGQFRLRRYEDHLGLILPFQGGRTPAEEALHWIEPIEDKVRREGHRMHAYLRWRLRAYQRTHPDLPSPQQVILLVRQWEAPSPEQRPWNWHGPEERPLACWRPGAPPAPGCLPVEMYHPLAERFETVRIPN